MISDSSSGLVLHAENRNDVFAEQLFQKTNTMGPFHAQLHSQPDEQQQQSRMVQSKMKRKAQINKERVLQQKKYRLAHRKVELGLELQRNDSRQESHQIFGILSFLRQEHQKV